MFQRAGWVFMAVILGSPRGFGLSNGSRVPPPFFQAESCRVDLDHPLQAKAVFGFSRGGCSSGCRVRGLRSWPPSREVVASPNEGLNAAADINFDSRVNAEDLGIMLAAWGDAPRNDEPPSECPLGLIP